MKVGIMTVSVDVAALAHRAEALGFDSFWVPEHTATPVHIAPKTTAYRLHLSPQLVHLCVEHQVNGFMGCDSNIETSLWWPR
jgi:alkanesulfonate monooxygenase SsuD/methylene tetrahydromethanopterin reductase-like flavin-dependent oxidoreductase (luciferase family)